MAGCEMTGVTVQTLHPKHFDRGVILAQTALPGFKHQAYTVAELLEVVAPKGAEMLMHSIRTSAFVPPLERKGWALDDRLKLPVRSAPKISSRDREIDWTTWTADEILQRHRIIGPLWNNVQQGNDLENHATRVIWSSGFRRAFTEAPEFSPPGHPFVVAPNSHHQDVYVRTCDGQRLQIDSMKIEGAAEDHPLPAARRVGLRPLDSFTNRSYEFMHVESSKNREGPLFAGILKRPKT